MTLITSIKLSIAKKLEDRQYRQRFFQGQAEDEIAMGIRSLRERREMRQADLARESGMKQSAISRIEQADYRRWSCKTLFRIANALDARLRVSFEAAQDVIEKYRRLERYSEEPNAYVTLASDARWIGPEEAHSHASNPTILAYSDTRTADNFALGETNAQS